MGPQDNNPDPNKPNVGGAPDTGAKPPETTPGANPLAPTSEPAPSAGPTAPAGPASPESPSPMGGMDNKPAGPGAADPQKNMKIAGIVAGGLVLLAILVWVVISSF